MSETPNLVFVPKGAISRRDLKRMREAGVVVIEATDPSKIVPLIGMPAVVGNDAVSLAALQAIAEADNYNNAAAKSFVAKLAKAAARKPTETVKP